MRSFLPKRILLRIETGILTKLSMPLPHDILLLFQGIHILDPASQLPDFIFSALTVKKKFDFKKAMHLFYPHNNSLMDSEWIWSTDTLPKIRFFLWLAVQDRLPHKKLLFTRNMASDCCCKWCTSIHEDIIHLLHDCQQAREVWYLFPLQISFFNQPLQLWHQQNLTHPSQHPNNQTLLPWKTFSLASFGAFGFVGTLLICQATTKPPGLIKKEAYNLAWEFYSSKP